MTPLRVTPLGLVPSIALLSPAWIGPGLASGRSFHGPSPLPVMRQVRYPNVEGTTG